LTVFFELIRTLPCASWIIAPKQSMIAKLAMFESSSFDMPIPIGCPFARSFGAALSTWSHVAGDSPMSFQRSCRQTTGSGT
jgi:pantoate kinase